MNEPVCIYGTGGHAKVVVDTVLSGGRTIATHMDDNRQSVEASQGRCLPGIGLAGEAFVAPPFPIILAVGRNQVRQKLDQQLDCNFATAIHPNATLSKETQIGDGTVVFAGSVVQPNVRIGRHVILNTKSSVDHDGVIGDFVHVAPGATLCGNVHVGEGTHVGAGATVIEGMRIGKWATIGAGAVVIRPVADFETVVGCPALPIKSNR